MSRRRHMRLALVLGAAALVRAADGGSSTSTCGGGGRRCAVPAGSGEDDDTGLLQARGVAKVPSRPPVDYSPKVEGGPEFQSLQRVTDITLGDLTEPQDRGQDGGLDLKEWMEAFQYLDADNSSTITNSDLGMLNVTFTNLHDHQSKEDFRHGMAIMVGAFPEYAQFMVENEGLLLHLVYTGEKAPADAPLPSKEAVSLVQRRIKARRDALLQEHGAGLDTCHVKVIFFSWKGLSFFLSFAGVSLDGLLGFEPPSGLGSALAGTQFNALVEKIINFGASAGSPQGAATALFGIIQELWNSGFATAALEAVVDDMGWWQWASTGVTLTATVALHMGTGGTLLIAQMALTILSATSLFTAAVEVQTHCT